MIKALELLFNIAGPAASMMMELAPYAVTGFAVVFALWFALGGLIADGDYSKMSVTMAASAVTMVVGGIYGMFVSNCTWLLPGWGLFILGFYLSE